MTDPTSDAAPDPGATPGAVADAPPFRSQVPADANVDPTAQTSTGSDSPATDTAGPADTAPATDPGASTADVTPVETPGASDESKGDPLARLANLILADRHIIDTADPSTTAAAVQSVQTSNGIDPHGELDDATLHALADLLEGRLTSVYMAPPVQGAPAAAPAPEGEPFVIGTDDTIAKIEDEQGLEPGTLYRLNAKALDDAAVARGFPDSAQGAHVFPGSTILVPEPKD